MMFAVSSGVGDYFCSLSHSPQRSVQSTGYSEIATLFSAGVQLASLATISIGASDYRLLRIKKIDRLTLEHWKE